MPYDNSKEFMGLINNPLVKSLYFKGPDEGSRELVVKNLLLEDDGKFLLETGGYLLLEDGTP
jgi:hypothetical protein